ncbi:2267_t:CDS:10, partial [Cetraspora pellucida]
MSSLVLGWRRFQKPLKNEYVEVQTSDEEQNYDPIKSKEQKSSNVNDVQKERSLAVEAIPPILISAAGLMLAGWLLDTVQSWPVFTNVPELYILVPVLLNLKGNLEMNLASRLSTSANLGELDNPTVRYTLIWGIQHLDNIACPLASSFGDLFTLIVLSSCSELLFSYLYSWVSTVMFLILAVSIPLWASMTWSNKLVRRLLIEAWTPLFVAMVISSIAGLVLEKYVDQYHGLAFLTPVLNGIIGNLGSIYASRISTRLHCGTEEDYYQSELTLFLINIPIEILILVIAWWFGTFRGSEVAFTLIIAKKLTLWLWHHDYDPDNYSLPYITAVVDVIGNGLLVLSYWGLSKLDK